MRSEKGDGGWSVALRDGEGWEGGRRRYRVQNEEREKERDETMHAHGRQKVKRSGREREAHRVHGTGIGGMKGRLGYYCSAASKLRRYTYVRGVQ